MTDGSGPTTDNTKNEIPTNLLSGDAGSVSTPEFEKLKGQYKENPDTFLSAFNEFKTANNMPDLTMDQLANNKELYAKFMTKINKSEAVNIKNNPADNTSKDVNKPQSEVTATGANNEQNSVVEALNKTNKLLAEQNAISKDTNAKTGRTTVLAGGNGTASTMPSKK